MRFLLGSTLGLLLAGTAAAQTPYPAPADAAPVGLRAPRVSYRLNAGAVFAGRYGSATYFSPLVSYQLSRRFSAFGGLTYLRTLPGGSYVPPETGSAFTAQGTSRYVIQAGGTYAVSPRVMLTGSAWKDLSGDLPRGTVVSPYAGFTNLGSGVNVRADFQLTEHLSVSGGVRVSSGVGVYPGGYLPLLTPGAGLPLGY